MAADLSERNPGVPFDESWFKEIKLNFPGIKARADTLGKRRSVKKEWQAAWLLRVVSCLDLTTLSGQSVTLISVLNFLTMSFWLPICMVFFCDVFFIIW